MKTFLYSAFVMYVIGGIGWVMNLYFLFTSADNEVTVYILLQIAGIFIAPMGSVLGFIQYFS